LAPLEEAHQKEEEPHTVRHFKGTDLCIVKHPNGWMVSRLQPDTAYNNHSQTSKTARLPFFLWRLWL